MSSQLWALTAPSSRPGHGARQHALRHHGLGAADARLESPPDEETALWPQDRPREGLARLRWPSARGIGDRLRDGPLRVDVLGCTGNSPCKSSATRCSTAAVAGRQARLPPLRATGRPGVGATLPACAHAEVAARKNHGWTTGPLCPEAEPAKPVVRAPTGSCCCLRSPHVAHRCSPRSCNETNVPAKQRDQGRTLYDKKAETSKTS